VSTLHGLQNFVIFVEEMWTPDFQVGVMCLRDGQGMLHVWRQGVWWEAWWKETYRRNLCVAERIILKCNLPHLEWRRVDWSSSGQKQLAGCCECGN